MLLQQSLTMKKVPSCSQIKFPAKDLEMVHALSVSLNKIGDLATMKGTCNLL